MGAHISQPDQYVLGTTDETISVTYSTFGVVGPQLTYHNETEASDGGTFTGGDLQIEETILGTLVSVTLNWTPDAERRILSVLLPSVLLEGDESADVSTFVVRTSLLEGRNRRGQMHDYVQAVGVTGTASRVAGHGSGSR